MLFIACSYEAFGYASTWKYVWENQIIEVPVGAELKNYIDIPKAYLYRDGVLLDDANVTYLKEGDWLYYLKDVDTSIVGEYKVWYKAFENEKYKPGTCTDYKCLITFKVVDKIPPEITIINKEISIKKGVEYNCFDNIIVTDNYDNDVSLYIDKNIDQIKEYEEVKVIAVDSSGNQSEDSFFIRITNIKKPVITFNNIDNVLNVPLNGNIDIKSFFSAYDFFDGDITNRIIFPTINITSIGKYPYTVYVTNSSELEASYTITINVIDDICPSIELTDEVLYFEYNQDFSLVNFSDFVTITDNNDIDYDFLEITSNIENKVGYYIVNYRYFDGTFVVDKKLKVYLTSSKPPTIIVNDIEIDEGATFDVYDYIEVYDESDPNVSNTLKATHQIDADIPGEYKVTAYAVNSSGISITKDFIVTVLDKEADISIDDNIINNDKENTNSLNEILNYLTKKDKEQQIRNNILIIVLILAIGSIVVFQIVSHKKNKSI